MTQPFDLETSRRVIARLQEFTDNLRGTEPPADEGMVSMYLTESTWQLLADLAEQFGTHVENVVRALAEDAELALGAVVAADEAALPGGES
jgi:hypothetical protein